MLPHLGAPWRRDQPAPDDGELRGARHLGAGLLRRHPRLPLHHQLLQRQERLDRIGADRRQRPADEAIHQEAGVERSAEAGPEPEALSAVVVSSAAAAVDDESPPAVAESAAAAVHAAAYLPEAGRTAS